MSYARWASKEEILNHTTRLNKEDEVKKSGVTFMYDDKNLYINDSEAHALVIGGTGSGKTQTTIMPQLYLSIKAGESFITNDHGGELFEQFSGLAKENGYKVQVINFRDMTKGNNYNPLYVPYTLYKKGNVDDAIELVENVGYNLLSDFQKTDADPSGNNHQLIYLQDLLYTYLIKLKLKRLILIVLLIYAINLMISKTIFKINHLLFIHTYHLSLMHQQKLKDLLYLYLNKRLRLLLHVML